MYIVIKYEYMNACAYECDHAEICGDKLILGVTSFGESWRDGFKRFDGEYVNDEIREISKVWVNGSDQDPFAQLINAKVRLVQFKDAFGLNTDLQKEQISTPVKNVRVQKEGNRGEKRR